MSEPSDDYSPAVTNELRGLLLEAVRRAQEAAGGPIGGEIQLCTDGRGCVARRMEEAGADPEDTYDAMDDCPSCRDVVFEPGELPEQVVSRVFPN